tara:strand:- start:173 stop:607 length:435 start_codon:yes stop_codon:yes gene_type:complete
MGKFIHPDITRLNNFTKLNKMKVTDEEFWSELRKNKALYSRTARALEKKHNITYSRQAVKERAEKDKSQLNDIVEENLDVAEEVHHNLMMSKDEKIQIKAAQFYLKNKGRSRGYVETTDIQVTEKKPLTWMDEIVMQEAVKQIK